MFTVKELVKVLSGFPEDYPVLMENSTKGRYPFNIELDTKVKFVNFKCAN